MVEAKVDDLVEGARREIDRVQDMGGAIAAVESGYMKTQLVAAHAERRRRIESGDDVVVGVNAFTTTEPNPLLANEEDAILTVSAEVEGRARASIDQWRAERDDDRVRTALGQLKTDALTSANLMAASVECAKAGATTGEWAGVLREVFGEYRAPTGVSGSVGLVSSDVSLGAAQQAVSRTSEELGSKLRFLVGKPGLDGHSNGAEQIAVRARDCGFEVIYQGIRLTPAQIVSAAVAEDVHVVGLSILSGSHLELVPEIVGGMRAAGLHDVPVIVGGIIPEADAESLRSHGVAAVFTPKDYSLNQIMERVVGEIRKAHGLAG